MATISHNNFAINRYRYKRSSTIGRVEFAAIFDTLNPVFDGARTLRLYTGKRELVATAQACIGIQVWNRTYAVNFTVHQNSNALWESLFACLQNLETCIISRNIHGVIYTASFDLIDLPENFFIPESPPILVVNSNELTDLFLQ